MNAFLRQRGKALQRRLIASGLDALLVTHLANWYYLAGFTGEAGALIVEADARPTLVTDGRFTVQARQETLGVRVVRQKGGLLESVGQKLKEQRLRRVGYDPQQVSVAQL